jgi:diguanylate cyclase (GGDEF)-like protein
LGDKLLQVSIRIGVTFYPQRTEITANQILRQADQAMYKAKLSGKNRCRFYAELQDLSPEIQKPISP